VAEKRLERGKQLLLRGVSGLVWVALFLAAAWRGPTWYWMLLLVLLSGGVFFELRRLLTAGGEAPRTTAALLALLAILALSWRWGLAGLGLGLAAGLVICLLGVFGLKPERAGGLPATLTAALLPGVGLASAWLLGLTPNGDARLLLFLAALWTADTAAYLVGTLLGRHKLAPELSPKKSWEGLIGALLLTPAAVWTLDRWLLSTGLGALVSIGLGLVVVVASLAGDLAVSALKRKAGVKDTGKLIPGHGGLLDRLDGFLVAAPAALVYLTLCDYLIIASYVTAFD